MKEDTIENRIIYNNNKLVADKIRKTLLNIRNVPGISAKRWIWELIQNAKDVPNKFNRVEIKIELTKKSLKFSHNGSYFTIENILGILQQVSSKDSKNLEEQTGKFGTGFIGTHLLSGKVMIKGVVKYKGIFKKFQILLDRTADSSEELSKSVSDSIIKFINNMNNANSEYENLDYYNQKQSDLDTSFEYIFEEKNKNSLEIAEDGINDLKNTAPITLSTQYKKISKITIIDLIKEKKKKTEYSNNYIPLDNEEDGVEIGMNTIKIKINDKVEEKYFYSYKTKDCRLLYQVNKKDAETFVVVEREKEQPVLYRDFPLIGSEKFHFPFFLDGFLFNPLETRNGLYLNGDLNEEAKDNRRIITEAIKNSIDFTKWLLEQKIDKRYLFAKTQIPEPPQKYDSIAIEWFINQQKIWRGQISEFKLVKDKIGNFTKLKSLKLPVFKEKFNMDFFRLFTELNVTEGNIPIEEEVEIWYNIMETDPLKKVYDIQENTWNFNYIFSEIDLLKKINDFGTIGAFADKMNTEPNNIILWLNKFYKFLENNDCLNYLYKFKILPNKNGEFRTIKELRRCEGVNSIPEIINPIYSYIFEKEINDIYLHEDITYEQQIKEKSFKNILSEFSKFFKENNDKSKKEYLCKQLISLVDGNRNPILGMMFKLTKEIFRDYGNNRSKKLDNCYKSHSIWKDVQDFWFNYHSSIIESLENIDNLRNQLGFDNSEQGNKKCKEWLNNYILFLKENSTIVEKKKIFPNQLGKFEYIYNLQYDELIPEILKNIYNILLSTENNKYEIKKQLLLKEIISYKGYNKFTQKEIIGKIEKEFNDPKKDDELKTTISETILSILPNNNEDKFITISNAIKEFIPEYNQIFNKNITLKITDITTELNYGIFLNFLLKKTFEYIQLMQKQELLTKIDIIPKIIEFLWKYQKDEKNKYLNILIEPSNYTIFVNQNNELANINDLSFTEKFVGDEPEIVKLLEFARLEPINCDFKKKILAKNFANILKDYKNKFKSLKLEDICKNEIDYKLMDYYERNKNCNLLDLKHRNFLKLFFELNGILNSSPYLKNYFPRLLRNRGIISLSFLDLTDDMDSFIEDIKKMVEFKITK